MKYESWLKYRDRTIAIQRLNGKYRCNEFAPGATTKRSFKDCDNELELKFYLLSLPNPPKTEILTLLEELEKKKLN